MELAEVEVHQEVVASEVATEAEVLQEAEASEVATEAEAHLEEPPEAGSELI